jgi:hypothetical protein
VETHNLCTTSERQVTDAELIRAVYPDNTAKRLARAMHAPIETARAWLYRRMSSARRRELAAVLKAEMEKQAAERALVMARIDEMLKGE